MRLEDHVTLNLTCPQLQYSWVPKILSHYMGSLVVSQIRYRFFYLAQQHPPQPSRPGPSHSRGF